MSLVTFVYRNILETGTVTSTDANASFPLARLYDRDIGKLFKFNSHAANLYIKVNQTPVIYPVCRLIIPAGHTLNGLNLKLQDSTTGAYGGEEHDSLSWAQADALIINKTFNVLTKQYWRLLITSDPATPPELPELYITNDVPFVENPSFGSQVGTKKNLYQDQTQSGLSRKVKLGEFKRVRSYDLTHIGDAQKVDLETWDTHCEGVKSFYILDHNGVLIFMEMTSDLLFTPSSNDIWTTSLDLLEVLA